MLSYPDASKCYELTIEEYYCYYYTVVSTVSKILTAVEFAGSE